VCHMMEPSFLQVLSGLRYDGRLTVQVGCNEEMLDDGLRVEEIYMYLEDDFDPLVEPTVSSLFEPVFAPFPGVVYTPSKAYHIAMDNLTKATLSSIHPNTAQNFSGTSVRAATRGPTCDGETPETQL